MRKTNNLEKLANFFSNMPGIGIKTAHKLAFHVLKLKEEEVVEFTKTILNVYKNTKKCSICQNYTEGEICSICSDEKRDKSIICVVETPKDVISFEKTNAFFGRYHVLHGLISPFNGIGPKQLSIKELVLNIKNNSEIKEIILATSPTVEGETTAMYIAKVLKPFKISVSRLAYGISVGSEIQYADSMTILKAIENRNKIWKKIQIILREL